jgi:hypothetical protein
MYLRYTLVAFVAVTACASDPPPAPAVPDPTPTPAPTATPTPDATPTPGPTAPESGSSALPPIDARCTKDTDCATTQLVLQSGASQCCTGCGTSTAGTVTWVSDVKRVCAALLERERKMCPMLRCAGGLLLAECKQGTCVLKK